MAEAAVTYALPHETATRLHRLGISAETIRTAVERGIAERRLSTRFDPPSYPGYVQWARTVRALRELLVPDWHPDDTGGLSTIVSPDKSIGIAVSTGDSRTGREGNPAPTTKYPRGPMYAVAVENNQLSLLDEPILDDSEESATRVTWVLLVATGRTEVRVELSCPEEISSEGYVTSWSERVILPAIDIEELPQDDSAEPLQPIDVPVERI
jgi:hypothetical protein